MLSGVEIPQNIWHAVLERTSRSESDAGADLSDLSEQLQERLTEAGLTIGHFQETIAELELRLMDADERDWLPFLTGGGFDFSRDFLDRIIRSARLHAIKNPLVKRAVQVYQVYVWGQGVTITAQGRVNEVVQAFLTDPGNKRAVFGHKARTRLQRTLTTDGTVPLRFFTNAATGKVKVRYLPVEQLRAVITDPDDNDEVWFYLREWTDANGGAQSILYPRLGYRPKQRPTAYKGKTVDWETPVYLHKVNDLAGMDFGVPEVYASLDWAKAVKEYLSDWKKFVRSLNRWAFQMKTKGNQTAVDAAQAKLDTQFSPTAGTDANPAPVAGSAFVAGDGVDLQPLKVGGAAVSAGDVRQLLLEMAAGVGLPETFFGDADAGSLATAKSLDRPTELIFGDYQQGWSETFEDVLAYVIDQAAIAPKGPLHDLLDGIDPETGAAFLKEKDRDGEAVSREVDIDWPPVVHEDRKDTVEAIKTAASTGAIDDAPLIARLLLTALGEEDIDAALTRLYPDDDAEPEAIPIRRHAPAPAGPPADELPADEPATERLAQALEQLRMVLPES